MAALSDTSSTCASMPRDCSASCALSISLWQFLQPPPSTFTALCTGASSPAQQFSQLSQQALGSDFFLRLNNAIRFILSILHNKYLDRVEQIPHQDNPNGADGRKNSKQLGLYGFAE